jgi:hypothetical protein
METLNIDDSKQAEQFATQCGVRDDTADKVVWRFTNWVL